MIFKNNNIARDTDAEHLARAQMMAEGIATYGAELDFTPAQIADGDWEDVCATAIAEAGQMDEAFETFHQALGAASKYYSAKISGQL